MSHVTRFERLVLGLRSGLGDGLIPIRIAGGAAARRRANWVLPGLLGGAIGFGVLIYMLSFPFDLHFGYVIGRLILFDYLVFFVAWLCGWNAAWRWRKQQVFIEDLAVTNLRPSVIGNLLFAGALSVWWRILAIVALAEALFFAAFHMVPQDLLESSGATLVAKLAATPLSALVHIAFYAMLAWFHLESLRIAYWMFAVAALPRFDLRSRAAGNLVIVVIYVITLTAVGGAVTGLVWMPVAMVAGAVGLALESAQVTGIVPDPGFGGSWMLAAVGGMVLVGYIKRRISRIYENDFWKAYLMFTWWGAGEIHQPAIYPPEFAREANRWAQHFRAEEEGIPTAEALPQK